MRLLSSLALVALCLALTAAAAPSAPRTLLVSVAWDGTRANGASVGGSVSIDGRYVAFASDALNIVRARPGGVFVRDMRRGKTLHVARGGWPRITPDGRFVVFCTPRALVRRDYFEVGPDSSYYNDAYVYNLRTRTLVRASMPAFGARRKTKVLPACPTMISDPSLSIPEISTNGRFVVFGSRANYIVLRDTNGVDDIFVRDQILHRTRRVSVSTAGAQSDERSTNGHIVGNRFVYFCGASNLAPPSRWPSSLFVHDLARQRTRRARLGALAPMGEHICPLAFAADVPVFVFATRAIPEAGDPPRDDHLVVKDLRVHGYDVITRGLGSSEREPYFVGKAVLSRDGRFVAFESNSPNFVAGDRNRLRDVFWFDRVRRRMLRVSVRADGSEIDEGDLGSMLTSISPDGRWVAWYTNDSSVVLKEPPGRNTFDVFVTGPLH